MKGKEKSFLNRGGTVYMCVAVTLQKGREGVDFPATLLCLPRVFTSPMETLLLNPIWFFP